MKINEYKLSLPPIWEQDWEETIVSLQGTERALVIAQAKGCHLLKDIDEPNASPERLGWLSLWSKATAALEVVASSLNNNAKLALQLTTRNVFELCLQVDVVREPISDLFGGNRITVTRGAKDVMYRQTIHRLCAYAAWCLWNDKSYYKEVLNRKTLIGIWDSQPAKDLKNDKNRFELFQAKYDDLKLEVNDKKLEAGRAKMYETFSEKLKKVNEWLSDPKLSQWTAQLEDAAKEKRSKGSFFELFDKSEDSISKRLEREHLRFAYCMYKLSSNVAHGSSMEYFMHLGESLVIPNFIGTDEEADDLSMNIITGCEHIYFSLGRINHFMINRPDLRI